jgi:malic enzyme
MYIFPGIGLGTILARARHVTDTMVEQAAIALSSSLTDEEKAADLVYPRLVRIRTISAQIALAVVRAAQAAVCVLLFRLKWVWLTCVFFPYFFLDFRVWMKTISCGA